MNELVSIVIPVFNTKQEYLNRCIDSLIGQTYKNIEIIIVDDGSKEACAQYLDNLALKYAQIRIIHQTNGGPSKARNTGLDAVKGQFFCLVDADDYVSEDYIEKLLKAIVENESDIAFANMIVIDENSNQETGRGDSKYECTIEIGEKSDNKYKVLKQFFHRIPSQIEIKQKPYKIMSNSLWMHVMIWGRMYRTEKLKCVRFIPKVIYSEDNIFCSDVLIKSDRISFVKNIYYYYFTNGESISHKYSKYEIERYVDYFDALWNSLTEYPEIFFGKFSAMMFGIMNGKAGKLSFIKGYKEVRKVLLHPGIQAHACRLKMEGYAHSQEKRTRYCLIHKTPFLMTIFIFLGKIKRKWKR